MKEQTIDNHNRTKRELSVETILHTLYKTSN